MTQPYKLFPLNLTAHAADVVRGNPVTSRPESGVENCFPGLEFDQRNLDKVFFPGVVFEFHHDFGIIVRDFEPTGALGSMITADDIQTGVFLMFVRGIFAARARGAEPSPRVVRFAQPAGLESWRIVRDLEPGPVAVVLGDVEAMRSMQAGVVDTQTVLEWLQDPASRELQQEGIGRFFILFGARTQFLTDDGVIEPAALAAGDLTRSLCAPWQYDFADCGCFYWASNKPDVVASPSQPDQVLNFQRRDRSAAADAAATPETWVIGLGNGWDREEHALRHREMIEQWKDLPFVYAGRETNRVRPVAATSSGSSLSRIPAFKERMIRDTAARRDWNYFGSFKATLERSRVSCVALEDGSHDLHDSLQYAKVDLSGKLVDIDPRATASQWFFDELRLGAAPGPFIRAVPIRRMSSRWLSFGRNLDPLPIAGSAATLWQTVFAKSELELFQPEQSKVLSAIRDALARSSVKGLMLRMQTYRTTYFQNGLRNAFPAVRTPAELAARHAAGEYISNPAYSLLVGVLGLWHEHEPESVPGDRVLLPVPQVVSRVAQVRDLQVAVYAGFARLGEDRVSLDFSATIPEVNVELEKPDIGELTVNLVTPGKTLELAIIPAERYARESYERAAGLIDATIQVDRKLIENGLVEVRRRSDGQVLLREQALSAVPDQCNVYLDEGESSTITVRARERGDVPRAALTVDAHWFADTGQGPTFEHTDSAACDASGVATFAVTGQNPGFRYATFTARHSSEPASAPPENFGAEPVFAAIRTLRADRELDEIPTADITWELVYDRVLKVYDAITPRMSEVLRLSDERTMRLFATRILRVTDPALFESSRFMPVTRNLSRGRRDLLRRWCERVLSESPAQEGAPPPAPPVVAAAAPTTAQPTAAQVQVETRLPKHAPE